MKSHLCHVQLNINFANAQFYKDLLEFMGWENIADFPNLLGYKSHELGSIWLAHAQVQEQTNHDAIGMNHLGLRAYSVGDVDKAKEFLAEKGTQMLFDTPRHRPEFCSDPDETYYQIMFYSPDNLLLEVLYMGDKNQK